MMADSNSAPPRCPCGFWGSAKTLGLCSKCFNEHKTQSSEGNSISDGCKADLLSQAIHRMKPTVASAHLTDSSSTLESSVDDAASTSTNCAASSVVTASAQDMVGAVSATTAPSSAETAVTAETSGEIACQSSKPQPGELLEGEPEPKRGEEENDFKQPDLPTQKNKKRCFKCNIKLELAIREIGRCRCEYVFCQLHRLPEQHGCVFDHKNEGRKADRDKMVSPKKHMGTSLKRIDSDS